LEEPGEVEFEFPECAATVADGRLLFGAETAKDHPCNGKPGLGEPEERIVSESTRPLRLPKDLSGSAADRLKGNFARLGPREGEGAHKGGTTILIRDLAEVVKELSIVRLVVPVDSSETRGEHAGGAVESIDGEP
jgi:hypothetical protein